MARTAKTAKIEEASSVTDLESQKSEKTILSKTRIVQRLDGPIFTWNETVARRADVQAGYLVKYSDGSKEIILDKATIRGVSSTSVAQREQEYIDHIAQLEQQITILKGGNPEPTVDNTVILTNTLLDGESPIPEEIQ